jgi:outer membrane protein OmpA-like peptidoglycan-associated protein
MDQSVALAGRLSAAAAVEPADPYAPVRYTASFTAAHPELSEVTLWLNLSSSYAPGPSVAGDLPAKAAAAVASGQWPASCRGFTFHLVVPSTGDPRRDELGELWWRTLIDGCKGTLASYTTDWLGDGIALWNLPKLGHGVSVKVTQAAVTFTVPAAPLFTLNSSTLSSQAQASLSQVAWVLSTRFAGLPVEVLGYTDASGTPQYNGNLSAARASAVAAWLSGPGHVPASLITPHGCGSSDLQTTPAESRRVEIVVGSKTLTAASVTCKPSATP